MSWGVPTVTLTIEGMRAELKSAILARISETSSEVSDAIDRICTPESVQAAVDLQVRSALEYAVRDEVERYFREGPGRRKVRAAVEQELGRDS